MPSFNTLAIRLYRRLFGAGAGGHAEDGVETVLDGNTAVAVTETSVAEAAALTVNALTDGANRAWRSEQQRRTVNVFGDVLSARETEGPRGALATAIGLAMTGGRATAFLSGQDLVAAQDLLVSAAGRHLPLVLHLESRALASQGGALGSGHEAVHLSADAGCFTLFASTVQQAVDFTLIARRVAEQTLIPGLVAMDVEQTALAAQDVRLPSPQLAKKYLGAAGDQIEVPTDAQKLLFGESRRRVPSWHDLDAPVMQGALQGIESYALGAVAQQPYFEQHLSEALEQSFGLFAEQAGRSHGRVSTHCLDDAQLVLLVQGSAIETAKAVVDHLRVTQKTKIGVLGIHCLRPFPGAEIARLLANKQVVAVLERTDAPQAGDAPLMREVRAALDRALENGNHGSETHPGYPSLRESIRPRLRSVIYGLGGQALRAADLIALCAELNAKGAARLFLGIDFTHTTSAYPKRQVLLDTLRRAYPDIAKLGIRSPDPAPDLRPQGSVTLAIHRITGQGGDELAMQAGAFWQQMAGGQVRTHPGMAWERYAACCSDRVTHAEEGLRDVGNDVPVDISLVASNRSHAMLKPLAGLREGGVLVMTGSVSDALFWQDLTPTLRTEIRRRNLKLYAAPALPAASPIKAEVQQGPAPGELVLEHLLGALFGALVDSGLSDIKARRLLPARLEALTNVAPEQRQSLVAAFQGGMLGARKVDYAALPDPAQGEAVGWDDQAPLAVRHLGGREGHYDSLPRFWDQVGVLYRAGESEALTADPYMAAGSVPPLSATFRDLSGVRAMLPTFDPEHCSGCGKCWSGCPDSAIGAVALGPGALIDTGIRLTGADALRQISSKLAGRISSQGRSGKATGGSADRLLAEAFTWLQEKMPLAEDRKQAMEEGFQSLVQKIGALPVALTNPLFHALEKERKDSGALLSLAVNPDACKGCGICVAVCEPGALSAAAQNPQRLTQARETWAIWEQTPDTPSEIIERAGANPEVGPMPAVMLSRHCALAVAGGDGAEAGSGEKIAVRMALAATEYQQQPLIHKFAEKVEETRKRIKDQIRETLTDALPTEDLNALASGLDKVQTRQVDVGELAGKVDAAVSGGSVDAVQLRRLIELANELAGLHWRLTEGKHGLGRSRFGLAVAPGSVATWAGVFPNNPFQVPVTVDMTGDTAQIAAGLLEGQLRETAAAQILLRRAQLELEQPAGIEKKRAELERLGWQDLNEEERALCPPLLLLGNDEVLAGRGFAQVAWLLSSGLPVKVLVLADLGLGLDGQDITEASLAPSRDPKADLGLMALAQRRAYVAQCSIAAPTHFRQGMREALKYDGPALIHVHVPSPERHGFIADQAIEQAELALNSRAFPLFRYNPRAEGVFGSRISLEGNPQPHECWVNGVNDQPLTPAHWAFSERRFAAHIAPLGSEDPAPTPVESWVELDAKARQGKTPFISVAQPEGEAVRYRIDVDLAKAVAARGQAWRMLQELAGLVTPFTAQVEKEVQELVAAAHAHEIQALKEEYEQRISNLIQQQQVEAANQIRGQLLKLAGYQ